MVEALYHGLPVVAHEFFETQWVLGEQAVLIDVNNLTLLEQTIDRTLENDDDKEKKKRELFVVNLYGWEALRKPYHTFFDAMLSKKQLEPV
jgi:glycosyltransferase involved in cell wall biosynthesis